MKNLIKITRFAIYILLTAVFIASCTVKTTDTKEFEKYGKLVDGYYYFTDFGRTNKLVFKNDSTGVIKEILVTEGVYYYFEKRNNFYGHMIK